MANARYFEDFAVGETRRTNARTITEADVVNYAGVSGDFHPYHMDAAFAANAEFGERIAHGLLVMSIAAALESPDNPHSFMYGFDGMRFVAATRFGDTIAVETEVTDTRIKSDRYGIVTKRFEVIDESDELKVVCDKLDLVERGDDD